MGADGREAVVEKIQKLLALGTSSNEHESALALARAHDLMLRHQLTIEQVTEVSGVEFFSYVRPVDEGESDSIDGLIQEILNEFFFVRAFFEGEPGAATRVILLGKSHHVEIAAHVYDCLVRQFKSAYEQHLAFAPSARRKDFFFGAQRGVAGMLRAQRAQVVQETGLILVVDKKLDDFIAEQLGPAEAAVDTVLYDPNTFLAGGDAGREMRLDDAVTSDRRDQCKLPEPQD
jgi:uncharacterized protein YoaH (UPF0181 family)